MAKITTRLVKDGNSMAVRIPKTALQMSGLSDEVQMEVTEGQIIISAARGPRSDWNEKIELVQKTSQDALAPDPELDDWNVTSADGID